jgi:hypothetical protein
MESYKMMNIPNEPERAPGQLGLNYVCDLFTDCLKVLEGTRDFAARELASQPYIRKILKQEIW